MHQTGSGMRLRSISATLAAPYNVFYPGQTIDISHAVITANFGFEPYDNLPIHPSLCTVSPSVASLGTTAITITYKVKGATRSANVPVTVIQASNVFGNNSWAVIAQAAYYGYAKYLWNPGDTKTQEIDGITHSIYILGFDKDPLAEDDAYYNDPLYNGGTGKTGLTLGFATPAGNGAIHRTNEGWITSVMRNTTLPALREQMPSDMKNNIRTVMKYSTYAYTSKPSYSDARYGYGPASEETVFLLGIIDSNWVKEMQRVFTYLSGYDYDTSLTDAVYDLFADGFIPRDYSGSVRECEWTRQPFQGNNAQTWQILKNPADLDGNNVAYIYNSNFYYFPVFNF